MKKGRLESRLRILKGKRYRAERVQLKRYLGANWRWELEASLGRQPLYAAVRDFEWDAYARTSDGGGPL